MSFGEKFGQLVKRKRAIEDLSQEKLADLAFGDNFKKTRISELENGRVARPHAKTVDALVVALNITDDELNAILNQSPHPQIVDTLFDYFDVPAGERLDVEIAVNEFGRAAFFHNALPKVPISRAEFFVDDRMLVFLTSDGRRRPFGLPVGQDVSSYLSKCTELTFVRMLGGQKELVEGQTLELKIIF